MPLPRCPPGFTDHVFKRVHGLSLPLRYWPPRTSPPDPPAPASTSSSAALANGAAAPPASEPWLLWVHGGGYTCGKWAHPTPWLLPAFEAYGLVSVGYRLQPEASLAEMAADVVDAYVFARTQMGLGARCVLGGASAGTTVAALAALELLRRERASGASPDSDGRRQEGGLGAPRAFLSVYGLLDVPAYLAQERGQGAQPAPAYLVSSDAELASIYARPDPAQASAQAPWDAELPPNVPLQEIRDHLGLPGYTPTDADLRRVDLYSYAAAHGNLIESVCRLREYGSEAEFQERVENDSPQHGAQTLGFVPTFLMHGLADDIVPAAHSANFAAALKDRGIDTEEVYVEGAGHVYDFGFERAGDKGWDESVAPCMRFLGRHV